MGKNVIFCGFMGCGKSTVGKIIAKLTKMEFFDSDRFIREKYGMKINDIFEQYGEDHFRELEHEAIKELCKGSDKLIALGGGALTCEKNIEIIKSNGRLVYISTPEHLLSKRLEKDKKRPLLKCGNRKEIIHELYSERTPIYKKNADIIVDGSIPVTEIAVVLIRILEL